MVDATPPSLHQHVLDGDLSALATHDERLLQTYRDKHGSTLLHYAAGCGHAHICRHLLQFLDVDVRSDGNGRTPLHWAARNGHLPICKVLVVEHDAAVDAPAKGQVTPLELAVWQCHLETARYLVEELGANPTAENGWGCTIAHWLGKCPIYDDGTDGTGERLRQACEWLFGECGVACNAPNHHGQTPLHKAAYAGNVAVVEYLCVRLGVIDGIRDNNGNTAADCAERSKNYRLARWIRRHASVEVHEAVRALELSMPKHWIVPPKPAEVRAAYLRLAKLHHPDADASISFDDGRWNSIRDAHRLLQSWWTDDPERFDCQLRLRSRNSKLVEHERLCWHPSWHAKQQCPKSGNDDLAEFESRLVRLLSSDAFMTSGLCLAQLPREYEKNFHAKVPSPREHGCRKLIQLLRERCPTVAVEVAVGATQKTVLRIAS